ncbi:MAG: DNA repair protein RecN [Verrucomicrobiae bacterium]|nr:DNA repair protein RecN [Verrucomicrobiae bacterium]
MLTVLKIRNLALVDDLTWEVGSGLVCVTGETGAGKSVIVGALKLVLGERADKGLIRTGEETCSVEAMFHLPRPADVNDALDAGGLDPCEDAELVVRRVISAGGQNKQFINGSPVTLAVLKSIGHFLVDLHGPHDHHSLLSQDRQLKMVDAYAQTEALVEKYRDAYNSWKRTSAELEELTHSERANEQELDLLRFQISEIDDAAPEPGEEEQVEQRYKVASNSTRLVALSSQILSLLADEDDSILSRLGDMQRLIRDLERIDQSATEHTQGCESAIVELEEMESGLRNYADGLELHPEEMAAMEERINTLQTLKRKYGSTIEDVLEHRDTAAQKLARIEGRSDEIERLQAEVVAARATVDELGMQLGQKRRKAAPRLTKEVSSHLTALGFKRSKFDLELLPLDSPGANGMELADFQFAPNPGEPSKPLRQIASSGEMSRVMLAVKSALARQDSIPLLVFDEIDANVGGEIAEAVGAKMASLGKSHQVISITHLPQVAALASCHYLVTKVFDAKRTRSTLEEVAGASRVAEIARMLGGKKTSAMTHARNLLEAAAD